MEPWLVGCLLVHLPYWGPIYASLIMAIPVLSCSVQRCAMLSRLPSCSALNMLLPLPRYLAAAGSVDTLPRGEGTIINSGPLALRKVRRH